MLTKDQATSIADALAAGERSTREQEMEMSARQIPWRFRSKVLLRLPPRQQLQLLERARRSAVFTSHAGSLAVCCAAFVVVLSFVLWSIRGGTLFWLLLAAIGVMAIQVRIMLVRLRLQELLLEQVHVAPSSET